jgi:oligo-1,6-glucosidase
MVMLRKKQSVLVYGKYKALDAENPNIYAYTRELGNKKILVILNFSDKLAKINTIYNLKNQKFYSIITQVHH